MEKYILKKIKTASSPEYITEWTKEGKIGIQKKKINVKKGKKSKASGNQFELRVRKDLEEKGYIVDKWSNNIDIPAKKIHPAKRTYNPFKKIMTIGTGFPDFICFQKKEKDSYSVIGVEVKQNGTLSKIEKEKCKIYLEQEIFSTIYVASKIKEKNKIKIIYTPVKKILSRMR